MVLSHLPALLTTAFCGLAARLHVGSAARLPVLLCGLLFARGRRTVTSWFRAAGITTEFRNAYTTVCAVGRKAQTMALTVQRAVKPLLLRLGQRRLRVVLDDSPTKRYGPCIEAAGIHHNPTPGPPAWPGGERPAGPVEAFEIEHPPAEVAMPRLLHPQDTVDALHATGGTHHCCQHRRHTRPPPDAASSVQAPVGPPG